MTTSHSNYLPQDILVKILHLLPFASLVKFKRVSKEWKAIINDPKFFNRYHDKSLTLFVSKGRLFCVLVRHNEDNNAHKLATDPPCMVRRIPIGLVGRVHWLYSEPSDAVACVALGMYRFLLYNLFTGASYKVADVPVRLGFCITWSCYGFGYDHYDDDHIITAVFKEKPVTIDSTNTGFEREDGIALWIYSFRNRAWSKRQLEGFPYGACNWILKCGACSSNGVLHWGFDQGGKEKLAILTYDLRTRRFGEMSVPPTLNPRHWSLKLFQVGGQLCYGYMDRCVCHVWVMKEYGVKESWAKLFTVDKSLFSTYSLTLRDVDPLHWYSMTKMALCEPRDGEKIAVFWNHYNHHLIWYDVKDGSAKVVDFETNLEK